MLAARPPSARVVLFSALAICVFFLWKLGPGGSAPVPVVDPVLVNEFIGKGHGAGGRWYIPPSWFEDVYDLRMGVNPLTINDAAELALELAIKRKDFLGHTKIPLLIHQTWGSLQPETWPPVVTSSVEHWLELATGRQNPGAPDMAYFLWDDSGMDALIETYEPQFWPKFDRLPYKVEKADVFRVVVLRWFGGVYADVDVEPLQHPSAWILLNDVTEWTEPETAVIHKLQTPLQASFQEPEIAPFNWRNLRAGVDTSGLEGIGAIFGIECDTDPARDDYWRWGYSYPVQITNWALAMAPQHPASKTFMQQLNETIVANMTRLPNIDPLDLTGPPALTSAVKNYVEDDALESPTNWNAVSGLHDGEGGRGKLLAGDVLVLPITGFSPGRGRFHNMGSRPITHPHARLRHAAAGSWRKTDFKVHAGKLCRTFFGGCKDWSKIPEPPASMTQPYNAVPGMPADEHF